MQLIFIHHKIVLHLLAQELYVENGKLLCMMDGQHVWLHTYLLHVFIHKQVEPLKN